jgi:predicted O-linked N-acetylglucosamine transferase (SPINDLY family)
MSVSRGHEGSHLVDEGNVLEDRGNIRAALERYTEAANRYPDWPRAHLNRGNALAAMDDDRGAQDAYETAIALDPAYVAAHVNLGNLHSRAGRAHHAHAAYQEAVRLAPSHADAHAALGAIHAGHGDMLAAERHLREALALGAHGPYVHFALASVLQSQGRLADARTFYLATVFADPHAAEALSNLGAVELALGDPTSAIASLERALAVKPDLAQAHSNLGNALRSVGRSAQAVASYRRARALRPDAFECHLNLGTMLQESGDLDAACASFRRALEIRPDSADAQTGVLFCMSHDENVTPEGLFAEHRRFGERMERASPVLPTPERSKDPNRTLRVGFVSADLREHPVANFFEPVLACLARFPELDLHAYYNHATDDATTRRLRGHFAHWLPVERLSDSQLAARIADDRIDILVDMSGHTSGHRLAVFARRAAPVQCSWLGYPGTTGLRAMDYYFADPHFLPLEGFAAQFTEKLVHLPANAPFLPSGLPPPVAPLPASGRGVVTFGSFNRLSKLRPSVLALWGRLLHALPNARILLGAMPRSDEPNPIREWLAAAGIDAARVALHPRSDLATFLALHNDVDLALDAFPYSGGTTTAYAHWMGVPVLTLAGNTPAGRQTAAMLGYVGLDDFVATTADDFVSKGVDLAQDTRRLADIRAGLRGRCVASPAGQPQVIATAFERALRVMWHGWCSGRASRAIGVNELRDSL